MKRIEKFYDSLRFDRSDMKQIMEAQGKGIFTTYTLTTMTVMNSRRDPNVCLWCGNIQSIDHDCKSKPDYNCWFTFGEEGESVAFVQVSRFGLQHIEEGVLQDKSLDFGAYNMFDEVSEPSTSGVHQVFDINPDPNSCFNFGLSVNSVGIELANTRTTLNVNHPACHNHCTINNIESLGSISCDIPSETEDVTNIRDAHKMLDEIPLPEFIREMADATIITQDDSLACERQLFAKSRAHNMLMKKAKERGLNTMETSVERYKKGGRDYINWCSQLAQKCRFIILRTVLFTGSLPVYQFHVDDDLSDGNVTHKWPHLQVKNALPFTTYKSVVKPLVLGDFNWFIGSSSSMIFGVEIFITNEFESENEWRSILNFKEVHSWNDLLFYCDGMVLELIMNSDVSRTAMTLTLLLSKSWHRLILNSCGIPHFVAMKKRIYLDIVQLGNDTPRMSILHFLRTIFGGIWLLLPYTLEDKGDFRGEEDKIYEKYIRERFIVVVSGHTKCHKGMENQNNGGLKGHEFGNAMMKFTYVVACQVYDIHKMAGEYRAEEILYLMNNNEALRVAYVDEIHLRRDKVQYYSVLAKYDQQLQREVEIFRVQLSGPIKLGEGKPENQNHAIIFTRGDALQTIDMNQDNYFEEALKMRNLLDEFNKFYGIRKPTILGVRENIFTGSVSSLAWFMCAQEASFVTLGQRVLASPLKVRMHCGHPDVFDRFWFLTRGEISKASKLINLSEDIFAGFKCTLRDENHSWEQIVTTARLVFDPGGSMVLQDYKPAWKESCLVSLRTRIISRGR